MEEFKIGDVKVIDRDEILTDELDAVEYIDYVLEHTNYQEPLELVEIKLCDDGKVDVDYQFHGEKFERIRRITGYLTGDLTSWNNAKRAEEKERVKHVGGD